MKEKELIMFSGGPDSTALLQFFLKEKRNLHVIYNRPGWSLQSQQKIKEQDVIVKKILDYFYKKYGDFDYSETGIFLDFPRVPHLEFGYDDQWNIFMAALTCRMYNIKKIWLGFYTYNANHSFRKEPRSWYYDGSLYSWVNMATLNDPKFKDIQILMPYTHYKGKEIDSFKNKKDAFNYLDDELKQLVRSCEGDTGEKFCGKCHKCKQWIYLGIKN